MNPGEYLIDDDDLKLNEGRRSFGMMVSNTGDRPIQVGSHFHFYETNRALTFDREATRGFHLDIPAGTAVRFEPGQEREIQLVEFAGTRHIFGFNAKVMGQLEDTE